MGSGQSKINNNVQIENQQVQQSIINSIVTLKSQIIKKRMISQDDDDDDEDDDEEELYSNEDSENEEQQFETKKYDEYVLGDKLVENKSMYSGLLLNRTQLLAIKKIVLNKKENFKIIKYNLQQLTTLRHQNLQSILSWNFQNNTDKKNCQLNVFTNFESNGSLQSIISKYCKFSQELILTIFQSILKALDYLHSQNKLHRNLKTSNILVDHNGTILISDILIQSQYSLSNYSAPETFDYYDYSEASDIWSAGCIFYELLTKKQPWQIDDKVLTLQEIKKKFYQNQLFLIENENIQKNNLDILISMFSFLPEQRPSANQLLKHSIFLENPQNKLKQIAKSISQKDMQNKPQQNIMSIVSNLQNNNNSNINQQPIQTLNMQKKEDDEILNDIKECVLIIQANILKEFTVTQNSNQFLLTKNNFLSLCFKQAKLSSSIVQQKLCHNKQNSRAPEIQNFSSIVSQMKTAVNFQGTNLESQNSASEKNFDQKSFQTNHLTLQTPQLQNQQNQQTEQSLDIQEKTEIQQIQKVAGLVKNQTDSTINNKNNNIETEQIYFDGDFVFIL